MGRSAEWTEREGIYGRANEPGCLQEDVLELVSALDVHRLEDEVKLLRRRRADLAKEGEPNLPSAKEVRMRMAQAGCLAVSEPTTYDREAMVEQDGQLLNGVGRAG